MLLRLSAELIVLLWCGARFPDIRQCCHAMLAASRFSGLACDCDQGSPCPPVVVVVAVFLSSFLLQSLRLFSLFTAARID